MDRISIGQHLVSGFQGKSIPEEFKERVKQYKIGNVILFEHNVESKEQLAELCGELDRLITAETGIKPLICIDQEGGPVTRLKEDAALYPSAMAVAAGGNPQDAYIAGLNTARQLRAVGVNYDLAPVADVNSNPLNPVIGVRSYGDSPETVSEFACQMLKGLQDGGVLASLKHFPGHGDTAVDSHLGLPTVDKSLEELEKCELLPFRAGIAAGAKSIMTTHILFPQLEPDNLPATMSRRIMTGLLRQKMGFDGLIISDCMMMAAIAKYYGTVNGTLAALKAGVDLVCICHDAALAGEAIERAELALSKGELDEAELQASLERILAAKRSFAEPAITLAEVGSEEARAQSRRMTQGAITLVNNAPFEFGESPMFLGCLRFRANIASSALNGSESFASELQKCFGGDALTTPQNPSDEEIKAIVAQCAGHSSVTLGLYNGTLFPGQLKLANALAELGIPLCCISLRSPYDLSGIPAQARTIAAYDYDKRTIDALCDALEGKLQMTGKLPVRLPKA